MLSSSSSLYNVISLSRITKNSFMKLIMLIFRVLVMSVMLFLKLCNGCLTKYSTGQICISRICVRDSLVIAHVSVNICCLNAWNLNLPLISSVPPRICIYTHTYNQQNMQLCSINWFQLSYFVIYFFQSILCLHLALHSHRLSQPCSKNILRKNLQKVSKVNLNLPYA